MNDPCIIPPYPHTCRHPETHQGAASTCTPEPQGRVRYFDAEAAIARAGVSRQLLRQCEARGLLEGAGDAGPSDARYAPAHIDVLRFARRALTLGFRMDEIATLLAIRRSAHRTSAQVKRLALDSAETLASHIEELQAKQRMLERLSALCRGDEQPDCPILDELQSLGGFASQYRGEAAPPAAATTATAATASSAGCRCAPASR